MPLQREFKHVTLTELCRFMAGCARNALAERTRYCAVIEAERRVEPAIFDKLLPDQALIVSQSPWTETRRGVRQLDFRGARGLLGSETGCVLYDCHSGFDPDVLGVVGGTIRAGEGLFLFVPPGETLDDWINPEWRRIMNYPQQLSAASPILLQGLYRLFMDDPKVTWIRQRQGRWEMSPGGAPASRQAMSADAASSQGENGLFANSGQRRVVMALARHIKQQKHLPAVLTADRGRGKSYALGLALAESLPDIDGPVCVTSSRIQAVREVFHALQVRCSGMAGWITRQPAETRLEVRMNPGAKVIDVCFVPEDQLVHSAEKWGVLVVDEAV